MGTPSLFSRVKWGPGVPILHGKMGTPHGNQGVWVIHRPDQTMAFSGRSSNKHRATDRLSLQNNIEILGFPTAKERQCTYLLHLGDKIIKMSESQISSFQIESVFLTE